QGLQIEGCAFDRNTAAYGGNIKVVLSLTLSNSTFTNSKSKYSPAIHAYRDLYAYSCVMKVSVENCTFENLTAEESAGAIGVRNFIAAEIINCKFINTSSKKNGGAVILSCFRDPADVTIENSTFISSSGDYGGALVIMGSNLNMENCEFINNTALYDGGAIYASYCEIHITNTSIIGNKLIHGDCGNGGGMYVDYSTAHVKNCTIINNTKNGIFAYDKKLTVEDTLFADNGEAIHGVFLNSKLIDIDTGNDTLFLNDTNYFSAVSGIGKELIVLNNTIDVIALPSRYDSRDWGWVTPVKKQGPTGYCWAFGTCAALDSALLKATGILYNLSVNNMAKTMLEYSPYGITGKFEGGFDLQGSEYILSWLGVFPEIYDTFDELGKISPIISTDENIHIVDAVIVEPRKNSTDNDGLKRAIIKCGAVTTAIGSEYGVTNLYQNESNDTDHQVCLVGWDDNFSASKFHQTPPGDGAFIIKNSMGTDYGDNGYNYISYYDTSLLNITWAAGFLIENTESYIRNYQYDFSGLFERIENNGSIISYRNTYRSLGNELISAVGTYFHENEDYTLEIYVNDKLTHVQSGIAPFNGYHTVKLTDAIPIAINDTFTVVMNKTSLTMLKDSRQHYINGSSQYLLNGSWINASDNDMVCCLKAYAVAADSKLNTSIAADSSIVVLVSDLINASARFNLTLVSDGVGLANRTVAITFNGKTGEFMTDEKGMISYAIPPVNAGNYTLEMEFAGDTMYGPSNASSAVSVVKEQSKIFLRNALYFVLQNKIVNVTLWDASSNPVVGKKVHITIGDSIWSGVTDETGTAHIRVGIGFGVHAATVHFDGDDEYVASNRSGYVRVIKETPSLMVRGGDTQFNVSDPVKIVKVYLWDRNSKPLPAGSKVAIKINGKTYTGNTFMDGIAYINIGIDKAGTYDAEVKYGGNSAYNAVTRKVQFIIK
ncbi:MAG: C1 family peptidase, partial [Methanobrevibacter sp.]